MPNVPVTLNDYKDKNTESGERGGYNVGPSFVLLMPDLTKTVIISFCQELVLQKLKTLSLVDPALSAKGTNDKKS